MVKYVEAPYQPRHTGKSGYIATSPKPKPYPYGVAEEAASAFYPSYREFIPKDFRKYSDSYIDLRNKPYKYWYDKWGKPHINKWWQSQLRYEALLSKAPWTKSKNLRTKDSTFTRFNGKRSSKQRRSTTCTCTLAAARRRLNDSKSNRWRRQDNRGGQWSQRRPNDYRYRFYSKY